MPCYIFGFWGRIETEIQSAKRSNEHVSHEPNKSQNDSDNDVAGIKFNHSFKNDKFCVELLGPHRTNLLLAFDVYWDIMHHFSLVP